MMFALWTRRIYELFQAQRKPCRRSSQEGEYITVDKDGFITLTDSGKEIAAKIYERHTMLTDFLIRLGVEEETAAADACKIEHDISDRSFEAIKKHVLGNLNKG